MNERKYFDFVLCETKKGNRVLFRAPAFEHLKRGDEVVVETPLGGKRAVVIASYTTATDDTDLIEFILEATDSQGEVKRIIAKTVYKNMKYTEAEKNGK